MDFIKYIKWIFLIIGTTRGNFAGGIIGFTIGYFIEEYLKNNLDIEIKRVFKHKEYHYSSYQKNLLALISEVVKADGYIHKEEIYFIKNYLLRQFGTMYSNMMLKTLKLQIDKRFDVKAICNNLKNSLNKHDQIDLVTFLYGITTQNGTIHTGERNIIKTISNAIGLSVSEYERIVFTSSKRKEKTSSKTKSTTYISYNPYKILGITKNATDKELKKAYRKMVLKFHPDKTDLDDEIANEKFSEISKAYHIIKNNRNIK